MATTQDIEFYGGEDKVIQATIYEADGVTPEDITGWSVEWTVREYDEASGALITKTVGAGITLTSPASGILTIAVDDSDTDALLGLYRHALKRTNSGLETVLIVGDLRILSSATR